MRNFQSIVIGAIVMLCIQYFPLKHAMQTRDDRILELKEELSAEQVSHAIYSGRPYENLLNNLETVGNQDTIVTETRINREINHWVPGHTSIDTITTKYTVKISAVSITKKEVKN